MSAWVSARHGLRLAWPGKYRRRSLRGIRFYLRCGHCVDFTRLMREQQARERRGEHR